MAGRAARAPRVVGRASQITVDDPQMARALAEIHAALEALQAGRQRAVLQADLIVGTNRIRHGLGRAVAGYTLTPTTADATFAHAIDRENPRPELELWVVCIGTAQTRATLEVY